MRQPRRDTRGIVDPAELMRRVRFRRLAPAAALSGLVEHYWFVDWDLDEPYEQHVVGHPAVNLVVMRAGDGEPVTAEVSGVSRHGEEFVAWAWAVNGFFSVVSSVLATVLSMTLGFSVVMAAAFVVYCVGVAALTRVPAPAHG